MPTISLLWRNNRTRNYRCQIRKKFLYSNIDVYENLTQSELLFHTFPAEVFLDK